MSPTLIKRALVEGGVFAVVAFAIQWAVQWGLISVVVGLALLGIWTIGFIVFVVFKYFGRFPGQIMVAALIAFTIYHIWF